MTSNNPAYTSYSEKLWQLHELDADRKDDSPEADELREVMAEDWNKLSDEERQRVSGLSHDFFSLHDEEPALLGGPPIEEALGAYRAALAQADWEAMLTALRYCHRLIPPQQLAYARGMCWEKLGDKAAAKRFYEREARYGQEFAAPRQHPPGTRIDRDRDVFNAYRRIVRAIEEVF